MTQNLNELPNEFETPEFNDVIETIDDGKFDIGQSYESNAAETLYCKKCKTNKFIVGQGSCFTAIKCPNCGWQLCIHDG